MAELGWLLARVAARFGRSEPRGRARKYVTGLVAGPDRKNGWTLAEQAGDVSPDGMQRLLRWADWDIDGVRDDLRDYVVEQLGDRDGVLILDDIGFLKKGVWSAGVQRQYSGTAGRVENCQIGVFLAYASDLGCALVDRELYLPEAWTSDRERCRAAGIPDDVEFQTKPELGLALLDRALATGVPFAWVTADETYGQDEYLRVWLEQHDAPYVLATKGNDTLITAGPEFGGEFGLAEQRADDLIAGLDTRAWRRLSVGTGAHEPREYDWARIPIRIGWAPGRGHWLLARRSISDSNEIAYYVCYGPRRSTLLDLAWTAGSWLRIEECYAQAKNDAGLDHYQARSWRAWYAHITLSMLALAWLAGGLRARRPAPPPRQAGDHRAVAGQRAQRPIVGADGRLDLRYVENWTLALDAQILIKTDRAVLRGGGAY